jgi:uroporphyrinogen-III synthase
MPDAYDLRRGRVGDGSRAPVLCMPPRTGDEPHPRHEGAGGQAPLAGRHVIVPASRVERNALADFLTKKGARVTAFPSVRAAPPSAFDSLDAAVATMDRLDWIVFSGEQSVLHFGERLERGGHKGLDALPCATCAIGVGAVEALRAHGREPDAAPRDHTPAGIAAALGVARGNTLLLVREETAADGLPARLRGLGCEIQTAAGYRAEIVSTRAQLTRAFRYRPDMLALASPTAARYFARAATDAGLDLKRCLGGVTVAAVGLATAAEAERQGLTPDLVSCGRLSTLARDLICLYGSRG